MNLKLNLIENAIESILEVIITTLVTGLDIFTSGLMNVFRLDFDTFRMAFPMVDVVYTIFLTMGVGMLILGLMWGLFKNFFGVVGIEAEDPVKLTIKTVIFIVLIFNATLIIDLMMGIARVPFTDMFNLVPSAHLDFTHFSFTVTTVFEFMLIGATISIPLMAFTGIFMLLIGFNFIKLLLETVERYIMMGVLALTAPLAFAMGPAQATNPIFKAWVRMFAGQLLLMILKVWALRMFTVMVGAFMADPIMSQLNS